MSNLRGYRRTRFHGQTSLYNNLEARLSLGQFGTYLAPVSYGLIAFNDVGRVWTDGETSDTWHHGYGAGVLFSPLRYGRVIGLLELLRGRKFTFSTNRILFLMMTIQNEITDTLATHAEAYVHRYFTEHPNYQLMYHHREHTIAVVRAAMELAEHESLSDDQREVLKIAALFHDLGYLVDYHHHEQESTRLARQYLKEQSADEELIEQITHVIMATCLSNEPEGLVEEILRDADTAHLSSETYPEQAELLRQERNNFLDKTGKKDWRAANLAFMQHHKYYTHYAQQHWQPVKEQQRLKLEVQAEPSPKKSKSGSMKKLHRGAETLFRSTLRNHMELSSIADSKANIMISVNSILLSVLITVIYRKIGQYPDLFVADRRAHLRQRADHHLCHSGDQCHQVTSGTFKKEDLLANRANPLFFGNFFRMKAADYEWCHSPDDSKPRAYLR